MNIEKEAIAKGPRGRTTRVPIGTRQVLDVKGKDPNYNYRIVNDSGDRIEMFRQAGYELVNADDVSVGDSKVEKPTAEGSIAQVSVGGGQKAYIVRIKKEWYEEDQKAKQHKVDQLESAIKQKALDGTYGKLDMSRS